MRSPTFTRLVLMLLALPQVVTGTWAVVAPRSFYDRFPGPGSPWVAVDGPFNLHLVTDAGAGFLAVGVVLLVAALWLRRPLVVGALTVSIVHGVPHAAYHLRAPAEALSTSEQLASTVPMVVGVLAAIAVLTAWLRRDPPTRLPAATAGERPHLATPAGRPRGPLARAVGDAVHARPRVVPARLVTLATLRVATLVECAFCIDILSAEAWGEGLRAEQLRDRRLQPAAGRACSRSRTGCSVAAPRPRTCCRSPGSPGSASTWRESTSPPPT